MAKKDEIADVPVADEEVGAPMAAEQPMGEAPLGEMPLGAINYTPTRRTPYGTGGWETAVILDRGPERVTVSTYNWAKRQGWWESHGWSRTN